jgi:hypothetical protein
MQSSGVGALGRLSRTSMPSLSNSPQMQGAPRSALAKFLWRGRSRISPFVLGRPIRRDRQNQ